MSHAFLISSLSVKIIIQPGSWTKWMVGCAVYNGMLCDLVFSIYFNPGVQTQPPTGLSEYIKWLSVLPKLCWTCILFVGQPLQVQIQLVYTAKGTGTLSEMHDSVRQEVSPRKIRSRTLLLNLFNSRHFIIHRKQENLLKDSCSASCFDLYILYSTNSKQSEK